MADYKNARIMDSGTRRTFDTGAVRDIQEGKGRCDLMPLDVIAELFARNGYHDVSVIIGGISAFQETNNSSDLFEVLTIFLNGMAVESLATALLDVAKHFEEGAIKYGENNWQKGLPVSCYIDSAIRHYLKWMRGDTDEPHDRAFVWNILCCIWTVKHMGKEDT